MRRGKQMKPQQNQSSGTLAEVSQDGVNKLLDRANPSRRAESGVKSSSEQGGSTSQGITLDAETSGPSTSGSFNWDMKAVAEICRQNPARDEDGTDGSDWEDGSVSLSHSTVNTESDKMNGISIEFDGPPGSAKQKPMKRATAEDKEVAELVHKVHLLCLLGRGRLIDNACNEPLIQGALLSLLPSHLLRISEVTKLTVNALTPLVSWFHSNFHVRSSSREGVPFHSALATALETHEGTPEERAASDRMIGILDSLARFSSINFFKLFNLVLERPSVSVAALSVALFRALNLTTRFVSIMDVVHMKPELEKPWMLDHNSKVHKKDIFDSSTLMVSGPYQESMCSTKSSSADEMQICEASLPFKSKHVNSPRMKDENFLDAGELKTSVPSSSEAKNSSKYAKQSKRKGDLEFERQLAMALSATAVPVPNISPASDTNKSQSSPSASSPFKRMKRLKAEESTLPSQGISIAIGSRKVGAPLYWAEIYCSGENMTGKWVHVDAVNAIIDGEHQVEAAAASCKKSLRYVVAFAGNGAKDVTRRYCLKWYKISSKRVNSLWWDTVLAPLKELESAVTGGIVSLDQHACRSSLEDMELQTRALTEPLPSNQQAYRNHELYAIEKWLTKYQILHPKGPVLGFCSGHPVYPRSCVQILHTGERWLREGLQVRANELPAKVVKSSIKQRQGQVSLDEDSPQGDSRGTIALYGKWQTEPLSLPRAVNGIVPKNERGQVDVWSEKCLPPGTVHLRLPRLVPVAKKLGIDFAPAMVGFEFRSGRSLPVFEGIVICSEFKDAILAAYAEEEVRREEEGKRRDERLAISQWYQLLSSMVTRQKLINSYGHHGSPSQTTSIDPPKSDEPSCSLLGSDDYKGNPIADRVIGHVTKSHRLATSSEDHEHVFLEEDSSFDEETGVKTKACRCGFMIEVEEL